MTDNPNNTINNKEHIFIVRCGKVALKGMNKPYFERMLLDRIKKLLKKLKQFRTKLCIYYSPK